MTTATQPAQFTGTKRRIKCPVHHGKKPSVAVGYIDGRAWAKCWSQGCASREILAALGISNDSAIPWTPPPAPRPRPTISVETLLPVSPFAASIYLKGIQTPSGSSIQYQRDDGFSVGTIGGATPSGETQVSPAMGGNADVSTQ